MYNLQEAGTEKVSFFCKDHTMRLESKRKKNKKMLMLLQR